MICIGIDIAKRSHVASAVDEDGGTVVESFKFDNTANGFAKMLKRLRKADATPEEQLGRNGSHGALLGGPVRLSDLAWLRAA